MGLTLNHYGTLYETSQMLFLCYSESEQPVHLPSGAHVRWEETHFIDQCVLVISVFIEKNW